MEARRRSRGKSNRGRTVGEKVTWLTVYEDFKIRHPSLSGLARDFQPYNYATIKLYFTDGRRMTYNYDTKKLTPLPV